MTILNIAQFGAKGDGLTDSTAAIQTAIDAAGSGDTVWVPPGTFMINALPNVVHSSGGVLLKSNMTLQLESGATIKAIPNSSLHYSIINVIGENISILGASSASSKIMGDRDQHPNPPGPETSQWGFGIQIGDLSRAQKTKNVTIKNITAGKCYGDGIGVNGPTSGLVMNGVACDSNYRQGCSMCDIEDATVVYCAFTNNRLTGLDLEPFLAEQQITGVTVDHCEFDGNLGGDIGVGSSVGTFRNIKLLPTNQFRLKVQPIFVSQNAGSAGTPAWAFLLNRMFYEGMHADWYRFWGYPTNWSKA